ncbi:acyltransferase family protein [Agrobacterium vitis]|uniref:acyltransferase family protein n=1 Tax=Agrobacterium vitis TaxID=373 RepID=UPI000872EFD0|nr:acyltransferase [Agrobacterium vitis]MCE6074312.1 acyltransferase family protein [Agrobacterium vitis]MUO70970.1 acyltransferase family protein [Agrobacterium vitis]MUO87502.1 acyltransferase family protein [Agrobacterium vitis]
MKNQLSESHKITSLEGLRGIMAWWVVLGHVSLTFGWGLPIVDRNVLAVDVFIILSGFVIARLIDRKAEPLGLYIARRGFRLFPLYLVVLALSTVLLQVQVSAWQDIPFATPTNANRLYLAQQGLGSLGQQFLVHVPLLQGLVPDQVLDSAPYTIVGQAWSISMEWQFYLLAPFFLWVLAKKQRWPLGVAVFLGLILATDLLPGGFIGYKISRFAIGICSYMAFDRRQEWRGWLLAILGFAGIAIAREGLSQLLPLMLWAGVLLSAAAPVHHLMHLPARLLGSALPVHLGQISYSVYLVHMVPLYVSIAVLTGLGVSNSVLQACVVIVTLVATYLLSLVSYRFIEKPGIELGARLTRPVDLQTA